MSSNNSEDDDWKATFKEGILPRTFPLSTEFLLHLGIEENATAFVLSQLLEVDISTWKDMLTFRDQKSLTGVILDEASALMLWDALEEFRSNRSWSDHACTLCSQ